MKDVQNVADERGIAIQKVGVNNVHLPFLIKTKGGTLQSVLATIKLSVYLTKEYKGTHMSRFIEVLNEWRQKPLGNREMRLILSDIINRLDAQSANIEIAFKYFIEKTAPVSKLPSLLDCDCQFSGSLSCDGTHDFILGLALPITALCPCSKEISRYGAHNQRGRLQVKVKHQPGKFVWIEDLAAILEAQGSSPVYALLKREDEKFVTEQAYDNPKFVEDILRDSVLALRSLDGIQWFEVECENQESIHNHSAYAAHVETVE